jgi:hypothetical protein
MRSSPSLSADGDDRGTDAGDQHDPQVSAHRQVEGLDLKLEHGRHIRKVKTRAWQTVYLDTRQF